MSKLVTIFGGSGFVGRNTVRALAKAGYRIRVATRYPNLAQFLPPMGVVGQIQLFKCDITDEAQVAAAVSHADAVVNLVGLLAPAGGHGFEEIHVEAAEAVAKAARAAGARSFVQVSALGADTESTSSYARTKAEGEARVRAAFPDATILRPSIVFGPEDAFFNRFAGLARMLPALPLIGGGKTKFQPVFVGDVAAAIRVALDDVSTRGKLYELAGPTTYTFKDLMQFVLETTGRSRALVPVPFFIATIKGAFLGILPKPLLTMDQVRLLKTDNVAAEGSLGLSDLGIQPDSIEAIVPSYLWRFRSKGQYEGLSAASESR
ncbi:MAG TPA: complex I NDUFA9 subunit family protein [Rhizomicrobium sp.]|nr:complex I NDUFA9 subunit family protein [Rhizomicrobium sp.]